MPTVFTHPAVPLAVRALTGGAVTSPRLLLAASFCSVLPDVDALGPVPVTPDAIGPYLERLDRVSQALEIAQHAYAAALKEHAQLVALLDAYVAKAREIGLADHPDLAESERSARAMLDRRPSPLVIARQLIATYQTWLQKESASR